MCVGGTLASASGVVRGCISAFPLAGAGCSDGRGRGGCFLQGSLALGLAFVAGSIAGKKPSAPSVMWQVQADQPRDWDWDGLCHIWRWIHFTQNPPHDGCHRSPAGSGHCGPLPRPPVAPRVTPGLGTGPQGGREGARAGGVQSQRARVCNSGGCMGKRLY